MDLVGTSPLFDHDWYLRQYPDVAKAGIDPLHHFMASGWREGRDPGPSFRTSAYLKANADVARSGMNPLVHYIEFGHSEGRGTSVHRPSDEVRSTSNFRNAVEPIWFDLREPGPVRWVRSYALDRAASSLFIIDDYAVGYIEEASLAQRIDETVGRFRFLAGYGEDTAFDKPTIPGFEARIADAWFAGTALLRTRWIFHGNHYVVRAFQHDPLLGGTIHLVGENVVGSTLDFVDLHLRNPYFPILFTFTNPDGALLSAHIFAFPSLCRGGTHYSEQLVWSSEGSEEVDSLEEASDHFARRLSKLRRTPHEGVGRILVDVAGSLGSEPIFQPHFQAWLERVIQVDVSARTNGTGPLVDYLSKALAIDSSRTLHGFHPTLRIRHDMAPTISILTANLASSIVAERQTSSFILTRRDPSQPSVLMENPAVRRPSAAEFDPWPRVLDQSGNVLAISIPVAIQTANDRPLTENELFMPLSLLSAGPNADRPAITWVIEPAHWDQNLLAQALTTLALQDGGDGDRLLLVGVCEPSAVAGAVATFPARTRLGAGSDVAFNQIETPLVGFLAEGVMLHDIRTAGCLASMLSDTAVSSVTCAILAVEKRGKAWHGAIGDGGSLAERSTLARPEYIQTIEGLWRSVYPIQSASPYLSLLRSTSFLVAKAAQPAQQQLHLCTTFISASHITSGTSRSNEPFTSRMKGGEALHAQALFG